MYERYMKRGLDLIIAGAGLSVCAIPMLLISVAIKLTSKGPVLFSQKRVGIYKTYFQIWKFRTMYVDTPKDVPTHQLSHADCYVTRVGKLLRKTSLDELPQLFNILKGDMSLIGPRPALWNQEDLLEEREKYGANEIKPGLTGWAQIHGRDELAIPKKARLDGVYARRLKKGGIRAFRMDCQCFSRTIQAVFRQEGIVEGKVEEQGKNP